MRYVEAAGVRLSVIGVGAWQFGAREWGYGPDYARVEAGQIVRRALELGINLIDTAEIYGFGASERIVGEAIHGHRESAFIASKIFPLLPTPAIVAARARSSAARLGVRTIDLYQVHWPNPVVSVAQTMRGMLRARAEGFIDHVGVSNFGLAGWRAAEAALGGPVVSNQVRYSLIDRGCESDVLPFAREQGRVVIAYSPLGQGLLSGRYDAANLPPGTVRRSNPLFLPENLDRAAALLGVLREVAEAHDATPAQIALAWLISGTAVVAIPGASSLAQLEANAAAADIELAAAEIQALREAAERFRPLSGPAVVPGLARARLRR